jgi:predicted SAM-dependent methyltransferase
MASAISHPPASSSAQARIRSEINRASLALRRAARFAVRAVVTPARPWMSRGMWIALGNLRFEFYLQRLHRKSVKNANEMMRRAPLRLNLGSGFHPKAGWINVDLIDGLSDLQLDLREPLPFPDASVLEVYSEHFFEHLSYTGSDDSLARELETPRRPSDALSFLRECHRVLAPGGCLHIGVPDAEIALQDYANRDGALSSEWWGPRWCDTAMHRVNYVFRQGREHQYAYDFETLQRTLLAVGFIEVTRRPFDPALDHRNPTRSLFVIAHTPT